MYYKAGYGSYQGNSGFKRGYFFAKKGKAYSRLALLTSYLIYSLVFGVPVFPMGSFLKHIN
ncbi:MAG: hypothetical protein WC312_07060, partial [Candidatus Omnitrophota bacterium]